MNVIATLTLVFLQLSADQQPVTQQMTVTASMVPVEFSDSARTVTVLNRMDIESAGVTSLQELIQLAGIHVRERGPYGVQSDISLRGASFEQTLVLIDGVKMVDPQTGHHLLNLPIQLSQIDRIEILRGPGSRVYGPNAFGGVINLITRKDTEKTSIDLSLGENGYQSEAIQGGHGNGPFLFRYSFGHRASDGYLENTDFDQHTLNLSMDLNYDQQSYQLMVGEDQRDFGANRFYHPDFPYQREETRARMAKLHGEWLVGSFVVQSNISHRLHNDDFILDSTRPDWYRNIHETKVTSMDLKASRPNRLGMFAFGAEWITESIDSSNLGDHDRDKAGLFLEQQLSFDRWEVVIGTSGYEFSDHGWEWWPGLDIAWRANRNSKVFGSVARSFRLPTFTELYYTGGGNVGNPDLDAEEAWNYELGYGYHADGWHVQASLFHRDAENMIDWVWDDSTRYYHATNFSQMDTRGLELELVKSFEGLTFLNMELDRLRFFYTRLDSELNTSGTVTKYLIGHPENSASMMANFRVGNRFDQSISVRYEQGNEIEQRTIVDLMAQLHFNRFSLQLLIDNAGDKVVQDFNRVPLPGRWVRLGARYKFQ